MASNDSKKSLDSAIEKRGKTRFYSQKFTYTWFIEEFSKCQNETYSLDIISPDIVINQYANKYKFQLQISPNSYDSNFGVSQFFLHLKVLSCPSTETKVLVRTCVMKNDKTDYTPVEEILTIKKHAEFKTYYIHPSDIYAYCLSDGNLTVKCTFTFRCCVSRTNPDLDEVTALRSVSILNEYEELLNSSKFSDVTLVVGNKKFPVHKNILATRSPVFSAMFEHEMLENKKNLVEITDVEPEIMEEVLRFIYANKVNNLKELTIGLFAAADKYQLESLKRICEEVLIDKLSLDSLAQILQIVDQYETCPRLHDAVMQFLLLNGNEVANWKNFDKVMKTLSPSLLFEVTKATMMKT